MFSAIREEKVRRGGVWVVLTIRILLGVLLHTHVVAFKTGSDE